MKEEQVKKINIVCSGGEMKGGFVGGFLYTFLTDKQEMLKNFDINFYCISASVPTVLYYLSDDINAPIPKLWKDELSYESKNLQNGVLHVDIESVIEVLKKYPYNVENILNSRHTIIFGVYNIKTKKLELISNKKVDNTKWLGDYDIYTVIKAAIAAPIIYDQTVIIDDCEYCDAGVKDHFLFPENDYKTLYILQNKNIATRKIVAFIFVFIYLFKKSKIPHLRFAYNIYNHRHLYKLVKQQVKNGKALLFEPIKKLEGGLNFSLSKKQLKWNYSIGSKTYTKKLNKILAFLMK